MNIGREVAAMPIDSRHILAVTARPYLRCTLSPGVFLRRHTLGSVFFLSLWFLFFHMVHSYLILVGVDIVAAFWYAIAVCSVWVPAVGFASCTHAHKHICILWTEHEDDGDDEKKRETNEKRNVQTMMGVS